MSEDGLLSRLAELRDSGQIEVGRTLNDWWIRPVEGTEPKQGVLTVFCDLG